MKLMTKDILQKAAGQYSKGASLDQMVVAKFFHPCSDWTWYLMNVDPDDPAYAWGIVQGFETEQGSFSIEEMEEVGGMERDLWFNPIPARELWERLMNGEHI
jgi:hypothetical protein